MGVGATGREIDDARAPRTATAVRPGAVVGPLNPGSAKDRGVVGSYVPVLLLAVLAVDLHAAHPGDDGRSAQQQVDAQSHAAVEGAAPVIPPGELLFVRVQVAEQVGEPQFDQRAEPGSLLVGAEDRAVGGVSLPGVQGRRDDVEVPADDRRDVPAPAGEVVAQRVEPGELSRKVGMVERLAVRTVHRGEVEASDPHAQQARSVVLATGQPPRLRLRRRAAEHRHAVPALLRVDHGVIAERQEVVVGEVLLAQLQFLQAHHVRRAALQPVSDEVHACPEAVDVPGGDAHARQYRTAAAHPAGRRGPAARTRRGHPAEEFRGRRAGCRARVYGPSRLAGITAMPSRRR